MYVLWLAGAPAPAPPVAAEGLETFLLFVGAKQSGKTTLITQFLNRSKRMRTCARLCCLVSESLMRCSMRRLLRARAVEDKPKPTVALEYTFGRRSNTTSNVKDIAHIWELGGGVRLRELINVPITPQRTPNAVVVVCVDLSKVRCRQSALLLYGSPLYGSPHPTLPLVIPPAPRCSQVSHHMAATSGGACARVCHEDQAR